MSIVFISSDETLALRSLQLREGLSEEECRFDSDFIPGVFHLGFKADNNDVICVLSCLPNNKPDLQGRGFQLRGMATHPDFLGKGIGRELVYFCIQYLKVLGIEYLWCNARQIAYPFYEKLGFKFLTEEFEIQGIGPHREMCIQI